MAKKKKIELDFTPSNYQEKIFDFIQHGVGNGVISAAAGSGKTKTIVTGMNFIPSKQKCVFLAFNKSIAEELGEKLKDLSNVTVRTSHSLGFLMLRRNLGSDIEVDEYKYSTYVKKHINDLTSIENIQLTRQQVQEYIESIISLIDFSRFNLAQSVKEINEVAMRYDIPIAFDECEVTQKCLEWGKTNHETIDYTDMLWLPVELSLRPIGLQYDWIFVDECFPFEQNIATCEGSVKIGKLYERFHNKQEMPMVKSYNHKRQCFEYKKIVNAWKHENRELVEVVIGGKRKVKCTPNEKFLTTTGYKYAAELKEGDVLLASAVTQPYHKILDTDAKDVFLSQLIGDGNIQKLSLGVYRCRCIHGEAQKNYLLWKSSFFQDVEVKYIEKNGYSNKPAYKFNTLGYCFDYDILDKNKLISNLNLKQLAINYMDNGSFTKKGNVCCLYSCVSSLNEIELLKEKITELINHNGIKICKSKSSSTQKIYYYLYFNTEATKHLHMNIAPYIHDNIAYKIHDEYKNLIGTYQWKRTNNNLGAMVVYSVNKLNITNTVYDIEVEDNHNFIITANNKTYKTNISNDGFIVHNCQDQSILMFELIKKCFKKGTRFICVGDEKQCINLFAGSNEESFQNICNQPNTQIFDLPVSYRCAKNIIKYVNDLVPNILARDDAPDGKIIENCRTGILKDGDMVLARSKSPLMKLYIKLLKKNVNCYIKGKDIGLNLIKMLDSIDKEDLNINLDKDGVFVRLYEQLFNDRNKLMNKRGLDYKDATLATSIMEKYDAINTLIVLSEKLSTKKQLISKIQDVFKEDAKGVCLSTIHKAKGLEADNVYILCRSCMPSKLAHHEWERIQEQNLIYVAYTRAKNTLGFISEKEIPPSGSMQEPMEIINELNYIENVVCKIIGKEPIEKMESADLSRFELKSMTRIEKPDIKEKIIENKPIIQTNETLLNELEMLLKK